MTIGIVIDRWKLPIFAKHLKAAGYEFQELGTMARSVTSLTITVPDDIDAGLYAVLKAAAEEAKS